MRARKRGNGKDLIGMIGFILLLLYPDSTLCETNSSVVCGDALSSEFVINELGGTPGEYNEKERETCTVPHGIFYFWRGDSFDFRFEGSRALLDCKTVQETDLIGSRTFECQKGSSYSTIQLGFLTKNRNYTALIMLMGRRATLEKAKLIAREMHKNLNNLTDDGVRADNNSSNEKASIDEPANHSNESEGGSACFISNMFAY